MAATFEAYIIRNATVAPNDPPGIVANTDYVPDATEFVVAAAGQKAALGSADVDGSALGNLASIAIVRHDDRTRFTAGSGPYVAPYINIWITDGNGRFAVVANEPSDPAFQPLYNAGYNLTWADLANKVAKVYENSDLSWLPTSGSSGLPAQPGRQNPLSANLYTFADLAGFIIHAPSPAQLTAGWPGLGSGAPRELGTNDAWGINWVFGDTLSNYVSGAEGYVVSSPSVSAPAATTTHLIVNSAQVNAAMPLPTVVGVLGDHAPGFAVGSIAAAAVVAPEKSDVYLSSAVLFGRSVLLGEVKAMSYWTKTGATHAVDPRDWYLAIYTLPFAGDVSTPTWYGSRFGSEPYFSIGLADPANTWNLWSTGGASNRLRFFESTQGAPGANFGSYTDPEWGTFLNGVSLGTAVTRRNQPVHSFSLQTGSAWAAGFTGQLDGLRIDLADGSVATVNFEAEAAPVAMDATLTPGTIAVDSGGSVAVTGKIDDTATGNSAIVSAEFGVTIGAITTWYPMAAADGAFDEPLESVTATFTLAGIGITEPGVYKICIRGTDASGLLSNEDCTLLAVFDPDGGFVTGGGWIWSPTGALAADSSVSGKANFGFVSKYKKGASTPQGSTEFAFSAGGLNFHSTSYEWLVVNQGGTNAQFKGLGQINGGGDYGFMLWATDGGSAGGDTFRIQIWDRSNGDALVYDNGVGQTLGGGNILVHTKK